MEKLVGTSRKAAILAHSEAYAATRADFRKRASFFHREIEAYLRFLIPEGARATMRMKSFMRSCMTPSSTT